MGLAQILQIFSWLFPVIHQGIMLAETIHGPSQGAAKLETVTNMVSGLIGAAGATADQLNQLRPAVQASINTVVAAVNQSGGFKIAAPVLPVLKLDSNNLPG